MSGFLSKSACRGHRPGHLVSRRHISRPDLIAKLLRERHVARFLVAPDGFGKTGLALEYCDTVFSFEHVFWINGKSPCFLRDLDCGTMASLLTSFDDHPFLVVIEDVPVLDAARSAGLSVVFDDLLGYGCEVLVTCAPSRDTFTALQQDRIKLTAGNLLLSDAELDNIRSADDREACSSASIPSSARVPALCWNQSHAESDFLAGILREEVPAEIMLAVITMLVLQSGTRSDVEAFGSCDDDVWAFLGADYPYLGIHRQSESFAASTFSIATLAKTFSGKLDTLALRSHFAEGNAYAGRLADALIARGMCRRACELVGLFCSRDTRVAWLAARSRVLVKNMCVIPAHELYQTIGATKAPTSMLFELGEAVRLLVLGDEATALTRTKRIAFDLSASDSERAIALLVLARRSRGETRARALSELCRLSQVKEENAQACLATVRAGFSVEEAFWRPLVVAHLAIAYDLACVVGEWEAWCFSGADKDALSLIAAWVFSALARKGKGDESGDVHDISLAIGPMERSVLDCLARLEGSPSDLFVAAAGLAFEQAREEGIFPGALPLPAASVLALHRTEMEIFSQRGMFDRLVRERAERRVEYATTHPDAYLDGRFLPERSSVAKAAPPLTVNLFGGLEVRIGDTPVDDKAFRRQKVKTLLALLVLNRGREFPRDRLVQILWPESDLDTARKNFYSIWSQLRRALSGAAGTCPYLVRHQNGCRLDERLLVTDIARFDAVCRTLLFDQPGADGWAALYGEIDDAFVDDLMPSEESNDLIAQARRDRRMQLVDALVAASNRLVLSGNAQEGLWFARAALRRDRTREDAYTALMQAQIAAEQRTAALETYFLCRRFLTSELGIDPSVKTVNLYRGIIETEEALD